ncbi:MAG TPA: hypothetical protein VIJ14_03695 [Rhabdochlamydiaceae bacterium]
MEFNDIDILFTYHTATDVAQTRFTEIREAAKHLGRMILSHGGKEEDKRLSIQKLRESVFYAIASIAVPKLQGETK